MSKPATGYLDASTEVVDEPFAISCPRCGSMNTFWLTGPDRPPRISGYFCAVECECQSCLARFEVAMSIIDTKIVEGK